MRCDNGFYNSATNCVDTCPTDYTKAIVDGDPLCVNNKYATDAIIVDSATTATGTYATLYEAMTKVSAEKTIIYLVGGSHDFAIPADIVVDNSKKFNPLYQSSALKSLRIQTAYCSVINVPNCVSDSSKAKVIIKETRILITSYFHLFEINSVDFDSSIALDQTCTEDYCNYCPYWENGSTDDVFLDDRFEEHDLDLITDNQWKDNCDEFKDLVFISSGDIDSGSFSILNCSFSGFRQKMQSLIKVSNIKVNIESCSFSNIVTAVSTIYIGYLAEVNIESVTVRLLNNGYEYVSSIAQTPFLILNETKKVQIASCTFSMNLVMKGVDATTGTWTSSFIHIKNFQETITIKDSTFSNNYMYNSLIYIDVTTLTYVTESYTNNALDQLTWKHLSIDNCTFSYNGARYLIYYGMNSWPHNFALNSLEFSNNYVERALIYAEKQPEIESYSPSGEVKYLTLNGKKSQITYSAQYAKFSKITFSNNSITLGNIYLSTICNVEFTTVTSKNNGGTTQTFNSVILVPIINDPGTYMTSTTANPVAIASCSWVYAFSGGSKLSITSSTFKDDHCSKGYGGIYVKSDLSTLSFSQLSFDNIRSGISTGGAIGIDSSVGAIVIGPEVNVVSCANSRGPAGIGIIDTNSTITYKESYCNENTGALGACAYMDEVNLVNIDTITTTKNSASGKGGVFYISSATSDTSGLYFKIKSCTFKNNASKTESGGVIYLTSSGTSPGLLLEIKQSTFEANTAKKQGSAVYISSTLDLDVASVIDACSFTSNVADKDAALMMLYNSGKLTVSNTPFKSNSGSNTASALYGLFNSDGVSFELNSCEFTSNVGSIVVLIVSSGTGNKFISSNLNIHDNKAVGIVVQALTWTDSGSSFTSNSSGGSQVTRADASWTNTKITSNSSTSSGGGIRVNNKSTFICTNCDFSSNTSNNNGGALMSESESVIMLTDCTLSGNLSDGSGAAIYIISSVSVSTIKRLTITKNTARNTGAITMLDAELVIDDCTITANVATVGTPGISANSSLLTLKNSKLYSQR